ncbi:MAG: hypothetical protein U9Q68_03635, partial [Euryarchaeota archaeon]|nr:hypothetical protein [Euryarchaeota archaeon]
MKTIYTALLVVSFAAIVVAGSASAATVNLVEKDITNWSPVSNGNYGTLTYSIDASEMLTYYFIIYDNDTLTGDHILVVVAP